MAALEPLLFAGTANPALAEAVAERVGQPLAAAGIQRFPDREVHVELQENPQGRQVFILQPTSPPPDEHLMELLSLADACRRANARRVTAVVPYFGYARQDRRARGLEAVTGRLVADLIAASGVQQLVTLDLHTDALEGYFTLPVERLTAVPIMSEALKVLRPENGIVVSPDLGAAKLADRYASLLGLPVAIVHKTRTGPEEVKVSRISGDVRDRVPIIVDDMISTGGTIEAAISAVAAAGCRSKEAIVAATHGLFVGGCVDRLRRLEIKRLLVTDSVPHGPLEGLPVDTVSVAPILAETIRGLAEAS